MQQARRQITFRVLAVLAFLWGCMTFSAGVSWLRSALEWTQSGRDVEWQQYSMSVLLLSFPIVVLLGTRWPRPMVLVFLLMFVVALAQGVGVTRSTGDSVGAALIGGVGLVGAPALLTAWLFWWRSHWKPAPPSRTISSR